MYLCYYISGCVLSVTHLDVSVIVDQLKQTNRSGSNKSLLGTVASPCTLYSNRLLGPHVCCR
jgi:hypothetical protein